MIYQIDLIFYFASFWHFFPCKCFKSNIAKVLKNLRNLRSICKEIFKSLTNYNSVFLKKVFCFKESNRPVCKKYNSNPEISKTNQVMICTKSLQSLEPKIQNTAPYHIKTSENNNIFKKTIKKWNEIH